MPPLRTDEESPQFEDIHMPQTSNPGGNEKGRERRMSATALLQNPLAGLTKEQILADVDSFVEQRGLAEHREEFRKGALLAQVNNQENGFEAVDMITEEEKEVLRKEQTHRWHQPFMLYFLCTLCAGSAIVQGMDQTAVNGAQVENSTALTTLHSILTRFSDLLLRRIRHSKRCPITRPSEWSSISMLCSHWVLDQPHS